MTNRYPTILSDGTLCRIKWLENSNHNIHCHEVKVPLHIILYCCTLLFVIDSE